MNIVVVYIFGEYFFYLFEVEVFMFFVVIDNVYDCDELLIGVYLCIFGVFNY